MQVRWIKLTYQNGRKFSLDADSIWRYEYDEEKGVTFVHTSYVYEKSVETTVLSDNPKVTRTRTTYKYNHFIVKETPEEIDKLMKKI